MEVAGEAGAGDGGMLGGAAAAGGGGGGAGGKVRVLVVDDSPIDRKIVERLLLRRGNMFEVTAVDGGRQALEALGLNGAPDGSSCAISGSNIDIILSDYCMPEMNGYELLKAVKEHKLWRSIPVVIMSSENDPQKISRCIALGAEEFILKPLQTAHLQHLRNYAQVPSSSAAKTGSKRKLPMDVVTESDASERRPRPRLAGVAVA